MINLIGRLFETGDNCFKRILGCDRDRRTCFRITIGSKGEFLDYPELIDLDDFLITEMSTLEVVPDKFRKIVDSNDPKRTKIRDLRFSWIEPIIKTKPDCYQEAWVKKAVKKRFLELNPGYDGSTKPEVSRFKIKSSVEAYLAGGETKNSLIDSYNKCGAAGKSRKYGEKRAGRDPLEPKDWLMNLADEDKEKIKKGYYKFKSSKPKSKHESAYDDFRNHFYKNCDKYPSPKQFIDWGKRLNKGEKRKKVEVGEIHFASNEQIQYGSGRENVFGIGSEAQMDTTVDDTHTRSIVLDTTHLGRLTFGMMTDSFSAMPFGLSLGPAAASFETGRHILINAVTDKEIYCHSLGLTHMKYPDWPVKALPSKIAADCGLLFGPHSDVLVDNLGIEINNVGAARGDMKGIIERHIGKVLNRIEDLVASMGLVNKPGKPKVITDPKSLAVLNYRDILKLILEEILYWIKYDPIEGYPTPYELELQDLLPTTLNLWNYSLSIGSDRLISEYGPVEVMIKTLRKESRPYDSDGISFYGRRWKCATMEGKDAFKHLIYGGNLPQRLDVAFSKSDTKNVFWYYNGNHYLMEPMQVPLSVLTFFELEVQEGRTNTLHRINNEEKSTPRAEKRKRQMETINEAKKRAKQSGPLVLNNSSNAKQADQAHLLNDPIIVPQIPLAENTSPDPYPSQNELNLEMPRFL